MGIRKELRRIRKLLLYGGLSAGEHTHIQGYVADENFKCLRLQSMIGASTLFFLLVCDCFITGTIERLWLDLIYFLVLLCIAVMYKNAHARMTRFLTVFLVTLGMLYGLLIAAISPARPATAFFVLVLIMPMAFCVRPIVSVGLTCLFSVMFIVLTMTVRSEELADTDIINCLIFGFIGCVLNTHIAGIKIAGHKMAYDREMVAEIDVLTGVGNNISYRHFAEDKSRDTAGMACIYIDVDELHEYNTRHGRDQGDRMLMYLGAVLLEIFERGNVFRTNGDEFVCFVRQADEAQVRALTDKVSERMSERSYSISYGSYIAVDRTEVPAMVDRAEAAMLEVKKKYYRR